MTSNSSDWHATACVLCNITCGVEIKLEGRRFSRVRGDKANPGSLGYTCEKALRLDHYQNDPERLTSPLRRRSDGTFEAICWDTAITEIAEKLGSIRDGNGGETIFHYGGGGQGNHLGGMYGSATRSALGVRYSSNALAQEKTGEFWVDGHLFGRPGQHTAPDIQNAELVFFIGKNPWHSHGLKRARAILKEIHHDPSRTMIVMDPRRTETADLADIHVQVRPGGDAWALAAVLSILIEEKLLDQAFLDEHTTGASEVLAALSGIPLADYCERAGLSEAELRVVARRIGQAKSVCVLEDLGLEQAPHSTLNSWLEKLLYLLTGNFGRTGAMNIHSWMQRLWQGPTDGGSTPVTGSKIIADLVPGNVIPDEILTDHPDRFRAMIVESANPAHSLAGSPRVRQALQALECLVVIDVAMTETARLADYVLPASSQYEKWETTLFTFEFPDNQFHLRAPLLEPLEGTLPEPEIHRRLVLALGVLTEDDLRPLHEAAAKGRAEYAAEFLKAMADPRIAGLAPIVLLETLGPTLGEGAEAHSILWGAAHKTAMKYRESVLRAGLVGEGMELGEALFQAIQTSPSGLTFTICTPQDTWNRVLTNDGRIHLLIPELLAELRSLKDTTATNNQHPFILTAGERRGTTANTIIRDPDWRRKDRSGALRISEQDGRNLGLSDGGRALVRTKHGQAVARVEITNTMQPGHVSLPNGLGVSYPDGTNDGAVVGVALNELTDADDRDPIAGTPWHKHTPAQVERLSD